MISEPIGIKGKVYNRLIKNATSLLDLQAVDIRVLDPIVALFLGACADEFELLYQELGTYQSRILERLSSLLLPDVSKSPVPSHAVACAKLNKDQMGMLELDSEAQFYFRKVNPGAVSSLDSEIDVFFTPVVPVNIVNLELNYTLVGGKLYKIHDTFFKDAIAEVALSKGQQTTCWLGFSAGKMLESLNGLNLFFDWPTIDHSLQSVGIIGNARFYLNEHSLNVSKVFEKSAPSPALHSVHTAFEPVFDPLEHIPNTYISQFVCLKHDKSEFEIGSCYRPLPVEFQNAPELQGKTGKENLIWIKVVFDPGTPPEYLQELVVIPNAFPVVNRKKTEFTFRIQNNLNLVPIEPESGFFLGMDSLASGNGELYSSARSAFNENKEGAYILRRGGITRFDSRDARTLLNHLLDLLRQENTSYKMMGFDAVSEMLVRMEQLINSIEQKVNREQLVKDESTYLFLHPYVPNDTLFVSYWTTNGEFGNQIRAGSTLNSYGSGFLAGNSLLLCTNTHSGKNPLSASESLDSFKNALLTRDRLVSRSDIRHFCKSFLRGMMDQLEISEVFRPSVKNSKGFEKVFRVDIRLNQNPEEKMSSIAASLKSHLELSGGVFQKFEVVLHPPA